MSAPNAGRQSPEPERQSESQQGTMAGEPNEQGVSHESAEGAKDASEKQKTEGGLPSNPEHPLQKESEQKNK